MKIYIGDRYTSIFKLCLVLLSLVPVIFAGSMMFGSDSPGDVLGGGFFMVGALYIFGYVCSFCYSGTFANGLIDFLLYPRRHLPAPPVITSRQRGLITDGQCRQAEVELFVMRMKNPAAPELTWLLMEIHLVHYGDPELAVLDCEYYFSVRKFRYHELNVQILMRYADIMNQLGKREKLAAFLRRESGGRYYSSADREAIIRRLNGETEA